MIRLSESTLNWLDGFLDAYEELSDASWEAATRQMIEKCCDGEIERAPSELLSVDPEDAWWAWVRREEQTR